MRNNSCAIFFLLLAAAVAALAAAPVRAGTNNDFQQWSLIFVNHHLDDKWSAKPPLLYRY